MGPFSQRPQCRELMLPLEVLSSRDHFHATSHSCATLVRIIFYYLGAFHLVNGDEPRFEHQTFSYRYLAMSIKSMAHHFALKLTFGHCSSR